MVHESFSRCASPSCGIVFTKWVSQNKVEEEKLPLALLLTWVKLGVHD